MSLKFPNSTDECLYFTRRSDDKSKIVAWVFKKDCPKCKKALMGKPKDEKTGKAKIRAKEYTCPECSYTEEKVEHENSLTMNIQYKCPHCGNEGEATTEYKRKSFDGIPSYIFICEKCSKKIPITKKMKEKGSKDEPDDE